MDRFEAYTEDGKPCRACISVEDMMKRGREIAQKKATASSTSKDDKTVVVENETIHRCDCPVDKDELGRSTWNLLHTMSVYYPEKPTDAQKETTSTFLNGLSKTYPCDYCAKDMRKDIAEDPPKLNSRAEFADWMCRLHNKVNQKTGKPAFDCSKIFERWKDGWKDDYKYRNNSGMAQEFERKRDEILKSPKHRFLNYRDQHAVVSVNNNRPNFDELALERNEWLRNGIVPLFVCPERDIAETCKRIAELLSTYKQFRDVVPSFLFIDGRKDAEETICKLFLGPPSVPSREIKLLGSINTPRYSRYKSDYKELGILGRGGFGTVYKVKSAYDNALYAIKKIKLRNVDSKLTENIFSEVRLWAKFVHHPNIVTYHDVWHEECNFEEESPFTRGTFRTQPKITEITNEEELEKLKSQGDNSNILVDIPDTPVTRKYSSESDAGSFASLSDEENNDTHVAGKFWRQGCSTDSETVENVEFSQSTISGSVPIVETQLEKLRRKNTSSCIDLTRKDITVFIKMELCKQTLEEYLIQRNAKWKINQNFPVVDGEFNLDLYMQLLSALQYIHHNHGIHRDIKPGNIFLKPDGRKYRVLLGDFGLACMESNDVKIGSDEETESQDKSTLRARQNSVHSIGVGTTTYAAPEQLKSSDYGPAVDLYSAGIVFFELYNNFSTAMERLKAIENLRTKRQVTPYMQERWSAMVPDIITMTDPCPLNRPSAAQLLIRFKADENEAISKYSDIIRGQKEENSILKKVVRNQKEEIIVLKKKLAELEAVKDKETKRGN